MNKVWKTTLVLFVAIAVGLSACAPAAVEPSLEGTSWGLESLTDKALEPNTSITLNFEDGTLNGSDGCNSYSSGYEVKGNKLTIDSNMISTLRGCEAPIMDQASTYTQALLNVKSYTVDGSVLKLLDGSGKVVLTFNAQSRELSGTSWQVERYNDGKEAVVNVLKDTEITAEFGPEGQLGGLAGCNNYSATYTVDGKKIEIGATAATLKLCTEPEGVMEQQTAFLTALESAATYHIDGDTLEIRGADDALLVSMTRAK